MSSSSSGAYSDIRVNVRFVEEVGSQGRGLNRTELRAVEVCCLQSTIYVLFSVTPPVGYAWNSKHEG